MVGLVWACDRLNEGVVVGVCEERWDHFAEQALHCASKVMQVRICHQLRRLRIKTQLEQLLDLAMRPYPQPTR